jgi:hypothetical protein
VSYIPGHKDFFETHEMTDSTQSNNNNNNPLHNTTNILINNQISGSHSQQRDSIFSSPDKSTNRVGNHEMSSNSIITPSIVTRRLLPIDYFDIFQLLYVYGCVIYFFYLIITNNTNTTNNNNNNWNTYQQLVGYFINSTILTTGSAVLSDILVSYIPGHKDFFETHEMTDSTQNNNNNPLHNTTNILINNQISGSHSQRDSIFSSPDKSTRSSVMSESPNTHNNNNTSTENTPNFGHKIIKFLYEYYYPILILLPIFVPFCTHCIVGLVVYCWIFLIVIVGFPLVYLLLMLVKDCIKAFITVQILNKPSNFGSDEHLDELRYKQSDRLVLGADIIVRLIVYFMLSTSFNYAYMLYHVYADMNFGDVLTAQEYFSVTAEELYLRDNVCYYNHIVDSVQTVLIFFNFL